MDELGVEAARKTLKVLQKLTESFSGACWTSQEQPLFGHPKKIRDLSGISKKREQQKVAIALCGSGKALYKAASFGSGPRLNGTLHSMILLISAKL